MTTILVVEDDPINWMVFQKVLKRRGGLDSIHSEDVEEVLNIVRSGEVSVVLMDVSLKNSHYQGESVDGIRITQLLKADPETAKLPVILVTANAMVGDRETFLKASGADGYIAKPILDHVGFVQQIKQIIADHDSG
ncbi:response regulator [Phormidium yuhuli AB48]|uniref:Response regulator n=1 Tax=Phormidium yuhuli AB48 TaxID=2940671 RepID=A0ABY5APH5_9CYAN|nr:response regulator [Phormidium yuhuli]USR90266.1 response regulator [Phormidium yuhuli AB48]